nr:hypothetical protein B0A51_01974 [Rachicladosporium sp. CCFEE 5018]
MAQLRGGNATRPYDDYDDYDDYDGSYNTSQYASRILPSLSSRYWTRKWIIQEIVHARTVVLRTAQGQLPMTELEAMIEQLSEESLAPSAAAQAILATPAARLILERLEAQRGTRSANLHRLIERYAANQCGLPCDHIYALYSLVGEHRTHLPIEYGATAIKQFSTVVAFVCEHEHLSPAELPRFAELLRGLLQISTGAIAARHRALEGLHLTISVTTFARIQILPESSASLQLRTQIVPLPPMQRFTLNRRDTADWTMQRTQIEDPYLVGRPDMVYLSMPDSGFVGLAGCRLEPDDFICVVPATTLVFIVRPSSESTLRIIGRAYVWPEATQQGNIAARNPEPSNTLIGNGAAETHSVFMNCTDLFTLMSLAAIPPPPALPSPSWICRRETTPPSPPTRSDGTTDMKPDHLTGLPPEIRLIIYGLLFTAVLGPDAPLEDFQACRPTPPILRTSGLIRREALPLFQVYDDAIMVVWNKQRGRLAVTDGEYEAMDCAELDLEALRTRAGVLDALLCEVSPRVRSAHPKEGDT